MSAKEDFFYNVWNLFNHINETAENKTGNKIRFFLDGYWHIIDAETGINIGYIDSSLDLCAWLNNNEYKPGEQ